MKIQLGTLAGAVAAGLVLLACGAPAATPAPTAPPATVAAAPAPPTAAAPPTAPAPPTSSAAPAAAPTAAPTSSAAPAAAPTAAPTPAASAAAAATPAAAPAGNVKEPDTLTIAWLPNNSNDDAKAVRDEVASVIAKATGKKVENKLTTDYAIAISALETGSAQLGWFGPYEYLTSHAKNPDIVPLVVESGNSGTLKDSLYYSRLLVKKGTEDQYKSGGAYDIDNIAGKRVSFVSTSSTSGFNMPATVILAK